MTNNNTQQLLDFITEYTTQDNYGTAYPIYFCIRDSQYNASYHFSEGDRYSLISDGEKITSAETLKELFLDIKTNHEDFEFPHDFDFDDISEFSCKEFCSLNNAGGGNWIVSERKDYENKGMFLLKSEAETHLKLNAHHYSNDARVYCLHAWRAPRQQLFLQNCKAFIENVHREGK